MTSLTASSVCPASTPFTTWIVSSRAVTLGDPAQELDVDRVNGRAWSQRGRNPAQAAAQPEERADRLHVLGSDRGHVHRTRHRRPGERGDRLLGRLIARPIGCLGRRGPEMRRDDDVGVAEQRMIGDRFGAEHVERRPGDLARIERGLQVCVDDQRAAGDVENPHAVLHLRERGRVQPALGLLVLRQMQRDEVRDRVDLIGVCSRARRRDRGTAPRPDRRRTR